MYTGWNDSNTNDQDWIYLVDGGLSLLNIPVQPLFVPARKVDVVFAVDSSADYSTEYANAYVEPSVLFIPRFCCLRFLLDCRRTRMQLKRERCLLSSTQTSEAQYRVVSQRTPPFSASSCAKSSLSSGSHEKSQTPSPIKCSTAHLPNATAMTAQAEYFQGEGWAFPPIPTKDQWYACDHYLTKKISFFGCDQTDSPGMVVLFFWMGMQSVVARISSLFFGFGHANVCSCILACLRTGRPIITHALACLSGNSGINLTKGKNVRSGMQAATFELRIASLCLTIRSTNGPHSDRVHPEPADARRAQHSLQHVPDGLHQGERHQRHRERLPAAQR